MLLVKESSVVSYTTYGCFFNSVCSRCAIIIAMECPDWISLASAVLLLFGIGVSLFLGLRSLNQTKSIQNKQFRNTLLKDIITWAEEVITCGGEISLEYLTTPNMGQDAQNTLAYKALAKYTLVSNKIPYVGEIAPKVNVTSATLSNVFNGIIGLMQAIENQQIAKNVDIATLYKEQIDPLNNKCADLIIEVSIILGKDIGSR